MHKSCCLLRADSLRSHLSLHLRICANKKSLTDGMLVHDETIRAGLDTNVYLSSLVVDLFGKCGALHDAHSWFDRLQERSVFSWNCLINAYLRHTHIMEGIQSFEQMHQEAAIPNSATFASVVAVCASKEALIQGVWLHARSKHSHLEMYVVVQTALISMYNKCGKFNDSQMVFEEMVERDTVSWNAMLAALVVQQQDGKSAIQFFTQMQMECCIQDKFTYATVFSACSNKDALKPGKQFHACALCSGFEMNNVMVLALVNMYSKCESVCDAKAVFYASLKQDMVLWNAVITTCTNCGNGIEVGHFFDRMMEEALLPDKVTFLSALAECANQAALWPGRHLHAHLVAMPLKEDIQVETALAHMYGKLGMTLDASLMFSSMLEHDTVSWNAMISIFVQQNLMSSAIQFYKQMQEECMLPNNITFTSVLSGCTDLATLPLGKHIHALVVSTGLIRDVCIGNALIKMYCKCSFLEDAHQHFDTMLFRDIITWNSLINGYAQSGDILVALYFLKEMCAQNIIPDQATYVSVLSAIANETPIEVSHNADRRSAEVESAPYVLNLNYEDRLTKNVETLENKEPVYTCKANVEGEYQPHTKARLAFNTSGRTLNHLGLLVEGMVLHSHAVLNGLDTDIAVEKALLKFYGRCGSLRDSEIMFEKFSKHDVISWNLMIAAYVLQGCDKEAILMFEKMQKEKIILDNVAFLNVIDACANMASVFHGRQTHMKAVIYGFDSDFMLATSLVAMFAKCDSLADARWVFDHLLIQDVVAWTSMIATYVQLGDSEEALALFEQMQRGGVTPDVVAFTSALNACESHSALLEGKIIHTCIIHCNLESDADVLIALVYMYGKCGSLTDARSTFLRVQKPNLSVWNALIASYAQHGDGKEVFCLLFAMMEQGVIPNSITFVTTLCACSRAGLANEAYGCLKHVFQKAGLAPNVEHYDCMVDVLGRVGQFDEAENLLKLMPFIPTVVSWASFLATCHSQIDTKRAEAATIHLIEMDPVDPATYVTLSNIYAAAEEHDETDKFCLQDISYEASTT